LLRASDWFEVHCVLVVGINDKLQLNRREARVA
jgi:hypothetical protein